RAFLFSGLIQPRKRNEVASENPAPQLGREISVSLCLCGETFLLTPTAATCSTQAAPMNSVPSLPIEIIGRARTPWLRREDAPHQPNAAPATEGVLEIESEYRAALADLDSFERI